MANLPMQPSTVSNPSNPIDVMNPFGNIPAQGTLEAILMVKNSMFSGFLGSLYKTFLYGDEQFNTQVIPNEPQETNTLEWRSQRYTSGTNQAQNDEKFNENTENWLLVQDQEIIDKI